MFAAVSKLGYVAYAAMLRDRLAASQLPADAKTIADPHRMLINDRLDAVVAHASMAVAVLVIVVSVREWLLVLWHRKPTVLHRGPFVASGWWRGIERQTTHAAALSVLTCCDVDPFDRREKPWPCL